MASAEEHGGGRAALPGFVATTVLTSSDGVSWVGKTIQWCIESYHKQLFGDNAEETRISDAPTTREEDSGAYKPLYERLKEMKDQKDQEWKEKNNPFGRI